MSDGMQRTFPLAHRSAPVVIVAVDEEALRRYGQWPWPRTRLAELVERIAAARPAAIAFDFFFPEPDRLSPEAVAASLGALPPEAAQALAALPPNDARFAAALRGKPVVLGIVAGEAFDPRFPRPPRAAPIVVAGDAAAALDDFAGHIGNIPTIGAAARGRGLLNTGPPDQVVRAVPLIARVQGALVPALGIEALRVASGAGVRLEKAPGGLLRLRFAGAAVPMQDDGTAWLRFAPHDPARFVSAAEVLAGTVDPARLEGKVAMIGIAGAGLIDMKTTPLGETVPGIEIHAQLVENVFNGVSLVRPRWAAWIEAAVLLAFAAVIVVAFPRVRALIAIQVVALALLALCAAALAAFARYGVLLDPAWPVLGTVGVYASVVLGALSESERQRRQLREQAARVAGEIDAAKRIQMGLLPDPREALAGDRRVSVAAFLEPARSVGGDFYDCFRIDEGRIFFAVADVAGKGLPAALFMASAKSQIKSAALAAPGAPAGEILARAQAAIGRENPEHLFVTVFAGVLDLAAGELRYANAGHEAPFARAPGGVPERFGASGGPPLGVIEGFAYPTGRRTLAPGEWICVVTDGVTEAMDPERAFFTAERLRATLTWLADGAEPEEVVRRVREDVAKFARGAEHSDDITLLALRWEGALGPRPFSAR